MMALTGATATSLERQLLGFNRLPSRVLPIRLRRLRRADLPRLSVQYGYRQGAEIGVWKGAFSAAFCEGNARLHMLCVDPWVSYPAWLDTKNSLPADLAAQFMADAHATALARLRSCNCTILREFSLDAARQVQDRSLDFVYIDANHVQDAVFADLTAWAPKVRPGGFLAGHDYRAFPNKPTIHVIEAVQAYTTLHKIDPWFVLAGDRTPSFLWVVH